MNKDTVQLNYYHVKKNNAELHLITNYLLRISSLNNSHTYLVATINPNANGISNNIEAIAIGKFISIKIYPFF